MIEITRKLVLFILIGLLSSIPGEVLNQILSRQDPKAFRITLLSYSILLFIGFFVGGGLRMMFKKKVRAAFVNYLFFGTLGLMVEWFLLGNGPALDPFQIVTQPGMFTFWGTMLLSPWILMDSPEFDPLKQSFVKYFASFSALYLLVAILLPRGKGGIFFGFIIFASGYVGLNYFYFKYFKQLAAQNASETFVEAKPAICAQPPMTGRSPDP